MHNFQSDNSSSAYGRASPFPPVIRALIAANVAVFVLFNLFPRGQETLFFYFGLVPHFVIAKRMFWQPLTYLFVHSGVLHLVINMLMLWMFGSVLENVWGPRRFLGYYFFCGIGAALFSMLLSYNLWTVGASGAIFGLLVAYAVLFPDTVILIFFLFPMKMRHAVWVLIGINLLSAISDQNNIAYLAHLGGGLVGFLYLRYENLRRWLHALSPAVQFGAYQKRRQQKQQLELNNLDRDVDRILDKISAHGINSLTKEERRILERKSRYS
ncbi:MAG: rhomboid family intramembrane serine protease [Candidatus Omnitrophica bacterium]|nr:rhomboid family intramembrane serine protease [Candidatus Omnitrophota bacterium]